MSVNVTLKNYLKDKINSLSSVQSVYGYMPPQFTSYPAVAILLPEITGEFASSAEDSRLYSFRVNVFWPLGQDMETPKVLTREEYAENTIATVIEDIMNAIDTDFSASGVTLSSNLNVLYFNATDMRPYELEMDNGLHLVGEITINIYTEKTVV